MKRIIPLIFLTLLVTGSTKDTYTEYISKYSSIAIKEMKRTGIPASITMAQAILESRVGKSILAEKGNNHFGIKCKSDWSGKKMYADDDERNECFRVYPNVEASFVDHSNFLRGRDRYKSLFELDKDDYKAWAKGLKAAGYATDSKYAEKLITIIERYNLSSLDSQVASVPATPKQLETPILLSASDLEHKYSEIIPLGFTREILLQNGVPFIYAREGESYTSIARTHNLFIRELLSFNDLVEDTVLEAGTIVYLARKKKQGPAGVDNLVVDEEGETLYRISQRFGIRLAALQKLNLLLLAKPLEEGDMVLLRKPKS